MLVVMVCPVLLVWSVCVRWPGATQEAGQGCERGSRRPYRIGRRRRSTSRGRRQFLAGAPHEVPRHQDRALERLTAEQNDVGRSADGCEAQFVAARGDVSRLSDGDGRVGRRAVGAHRSVEHDDSVLEADIERHSDRVPHTQVDADESGVPGSRPALAASANRPTSTVAVAPGNSTSVRCAWCSKAAGPWRVASGWASHNWMPCRRPLKCPVGSSLCDTP